MTSAGINFVPGMSYAGRWARGLAAILTPIPQERHSSWMKRPTRAAKLGAGWVKTRRDRADHRVGRTPSKRWHREPTWGALMRQVLRVGTALLVVGCGAATSAGVATPSMTSPAIQSPTSAPTVLPTPAAFPTEAFAAISEDPVSEELAAKLQAALALHDVTGGGGMSATVMTAEGTWSGTTGKADGVRDLQVDDQFSIASITKSVVAAQVMLMVEAGELALDDLVADHLPADLPFDTNGATIRHLLGHRSGLPDYYELGPLENIQTDAQRVWTPTELLALVPTERTPPGGTFFYAETNYLLLKLVIEHLRGRPLTDVATGRRPRHRRAGAARLPAR